MESSPRSQPDADKKPAIRAEEKLLLSRRDAAQVLSISQRALDYLVATRRLPTRRIGGRVLIPMADLRKRLRLSQGRFADRFGLSVDAVRHWESGRRQPEAAARALLIVIAADPEFVMRSLAKSA
jgi:hypothetical protein